VNNTINSPPEDISNISVINKIKNFGVFRFILWVLAIGLSLVVIYLLIAKVFPPSSNINSETTAIVTGVDPVDVDLPQFAFPTSKTENILRRAIYDTDIPVRQKGVVESYTVLQGDSLFGIAEENNISPETLLWANFSVLNDNPDEIVPGMVLSVPPVNGVYYQWQEGDTFDTVASNFETAPEKIVNWFGNNLDIVNPSVDPGNWIMVVDGQREFKQWVIPIVARGSAGVSSTAYGPGGCVGPFDGAYGTGSFAWPSSIHTLVGNDFWSGHLALDIATGEGLSILAADSGVVVFAGWANGGYGNTVMIDHGNGYATLYAHMAYVSIGCNASVAKGQSVGGGGSSGNSTGPHLHFEVRLWGGFINPWFVLPAP
jgi:murein DD-endopeptidase MepM/ murein hydrolase activator NlpD